MSPDICYVCASVGVRRTGDQGANVCAPHRPKPAVFIDTCPEEYRAFRDHIEFGPLPKWHLAGYEIEKLLQAKWASERDHEAAPTYETARRLYFTTRELRRAQEHNGKVSSKRRVIS